MKVRIKFTSPNKSSIDIDAPSVMSALGMAEHVIRPCEHSFDSADWPPVVVGVDKKCAEVSVHDMKRVIDGELAFMDLFKEYEF